MPDCSCCGENVPEELMEVGHKDPTLVAGGIIECVETIGGCGECMSLFNFCCVSVGGEELAEKALGEFMPCGGPAVKDGRWQMKLNHLPLDAAERAWAHLDAAVKKGEKE